MTDAPSNKSSAVNDDRGVEARPTWSFACTLGVLVIAAVVCAKAAMFAVQDFQMDFFGLWDGFRIFLAGASPYFNTPEYYSRTFSDSLNSMNRYPPAAFVLAWFGALSYARAKLVWTCLLLAGMGVQLLIVRRRLGKTEAFVLAALMLSFPVEFALQRGQIDLLIATLTTVFVIGYLHGWRRLGLIMLAVAASIKIIPGILILLVFKQRDWRGVGLFCILMLAINITASLGASMVWPDMAPDFIQAVRIGDRAIPNPAPQPGISELVESNRLIFETDIYRYSLNYVGSYGSIALHHPINRWLDSAFGFKLHEYAVSALGLIALTLLSWRSEPRLFAARLLLAYCILNPIGWGTGLTVALAGLVLIYQRQRDYLGAEEPITFARLLRQPTIVMFWLAAFYLLSPRLAPWHHHVSAETLRCVTVIFLIVLAEPNLLARLASAVRMVRKSSTVMEPSHPC